MRSTLLKQICGATIGGSLLIMGCSSDPEEISMLSIFNDSFIRSFEGSLYVIEKFGADNITKISTDAQPQLFIGESDYSSGVLERYSLVSDEFKSITSGNIIYQTHLGDNYNPSEIAFVNSTKAYICYLNHNAITIFNPTTGAATGSIDLPAWGDTILTNAVDLELVGNTLYVLLQRLKGYDPGLQSLIVAINTSTDALSADTFQLQNKNAQCMAYYNGALYVTVMGSYTIGDGAIEKVDLTTKMISTVIDETTLGGNPYQIIHTQGDFFYLQNLIIFGNEPVVKLNSLTGTIVDTLNGVVDAFGGICYDAVDSTLYVGERNTTAGFGIKAFKNGLKVGGTIRSSRSIQPYSLAVLR